MARKTWGELHARSARSRSSIGEFGMYVGTGVERPLPAAGILAHSGETVNDFGEIIEARNELELFKAQVDADVGGTWISGDNHWQLKRLLDDDGRMTIWLVVAA